MHAALRFERDPPGGGLVAVQCIHWGQLWPLPGTHDVWSWWPQARRVNLLECGCVTRCGCGSGHPVYCSGCYAGLHGWQAVTLMPLGPGAPCVKRIRILRPHILAQTLPPSSSGASPLREIA